MRIEPTPEVEGIIGEYADAMGVSPEEVVCRAVREYIEDSEDDPDLDRAIARCRSEPVMYSMEDVRRRYGL